MSASCPLCAAKDERIEELEEELRQLVGLARQAPPPLEWRLTPQEARVIGVLLMREIATKEAIMAALYSDQPCGEEVNPKIVDVYVCKARKKLAPFGMQIKTAWGRGYYIEREQRDAALAQMAGKGGA